MGGFYFKNPATKLVLVGWVVWVLFCSIVLVGFVLFLNGRNVKVLVSEINLIISRDLEFGEQNRKCALNSTGLSSSQQNLGPKKTEGGKMGLD